MGCFLRHTRSQMIARTGQGNSTASLLVAQNRGNRLSGLRQDIRLRAGGVRIHRFIYRIGVAWAFWVRTRRIFVWEGFLAITASNCDFCGPLRNVCEIAMFQTLSAVAPDRALSAQTVLCFVALGFCSTKRDDIRADRANLPSCARNRLAQMAFSATLGDGNQFDTGSPDLDDVLNFSALQGLRNRRNIRDRSMRRVGLVFADNAIGLLRPAISQNSYRASELNSLGIGCGNNNLSRRFSRNPISLFARNCCYCSPIT